MANAIDTKDVHARRVTLTWTRWNVHVLRPRPWMAEMLELVETTLIRPDLIFRDKEFPDRECFYAKFPRYLDADYMKVVVRYTQDNEGTVVTAFVHRDHTAGEVQLWPK